jgi:hypothetical protein
MITLTVSFLNWMFTGTAGAPGPLPTGSTPTYYIYGF